jgi:hypothetical protein
MLDSLKGHLACTETVAVPVIPDVKCAVRGMLTALVAEIWELSKVQKCRLEVVKELSCGRRAVLRNEMSDSIEVLRS